MVPRGDGLRDRRGPFGLQRGQEDGALHLGARDLGFEPDPRSPAPWIVTGGCPLSVATSAPIARSGAASLHRSRREAGVAGEHRHEGTRGHQPGEEPHRGTRVPAIELSIGSPERSTTFTVKVERGKVEGRGILVPRGTVAFIRGPRARGPSLECRSSRRSELGETGRGGPDIEECGRPSSEAARPAAVTARIGQRWAIDLSPGTADRPPGERPGRTDLHRRSHASRIGSRPRPSAPRWHRPPSRPQRSGARSRPPSGE